MTFCLGLMGYVSLIYQFGFDLTATGKVATLRDSEDELNKYFCSVIFAKCLLALVATILFFIFIFIYDDFHDLHNILYALIPGVIGGVFFPNWFYQGLEKMKTITIFTIISRLTTTPLIFIFVHDKSDVWLAALFQSSAILLAATAAFIHIIFTKKITSVHFDIGEIKKTVIDGWHIFLSMFVNNLYNASIPVFIGLVLTPTFVGYYTSALTIRNSILGLMNPIYQSIYPKVNYLISKNVDAGMFIVKKYFIVCATFTFFLSLILVINSSLVIEFFMGEGYEPSHYIFKILSLTIFINVCGNFFGAQTLLPLGYKKLIGKIVMVCGVANILVVYLMLKIVGVTGAAYSLLLLEMMLLFSYALAHKIKDINIFKAKAEKMLTTV